jgi:hypothetical protein
LVFSVLMFSPVLSFCCLVLYSMQVFCLHSLIHVEIITEKSHSALCSTAKGLVIQGKADTSIRPSSKPCSDELIRYISLAVPSPLHEH